LPNEHVAEVQRARLLAGAVSAVDEVGYARTTVAEITSRARVSRRTFYELFLNREECLVAVFEGTVERIRSRLARAELAGLPWRERVRSGLSVILAFLDDEPGLARVCVVQSARGGQRVLERREQLFRELTVVVDEGRLQAVRGRYSPPLMAEGLVGAALSIVYARLLRGEHEPLTGLTSELTGLIVLPYLGPAAAPRDDLPLAPASRVERSARSNTALVDLEIDPLRDIPMRLTYRTMRVLEVLAEHPGLSNRRVGERAGIPDQGQISKLLARLERIGLLNNTGQGHVKGEANAWRLTARGKQVTQTIRAHAGNNREVA
jgi:AcrR family transcriptional regulator/DNA-binding MarR family transcriptional regulator